MAKCNGAAIQATLPTFMVVTILLLGFTSVVWAQTMPSSLSWTGATLKNCQEQLAASRGAVDKIHLPTAAFQAESLVALDTRLTEALQQQRQDAATIEGLRQEVEALKQSRTAPIPEAKPEG